MSLRESRGEKRWWPCIAVLLLAAGTLAAEPRGTGTEWRLIFSDDFEGPRLDGSRWRVEDIAPNKNNELEYYAPDEVFVSNGCLVLRSRRRARGGREFTSGLVDTRGRMAQAFGRFEVRARLPAGQGIWPAIWLLPASGAWPPEVDIVELLGDNPHTVYMTEHWGKWPDIREDGGQFSGPDFSADFHVFRLDWLPEKITWYIDGVKRFETAEFIPRTPMYLIMNTAVGGDWPGEPDETTTFPVYHYIDYVRVYMPVERERTYLHLAARNGWVEVAPFRFVFSRGERVRLRAVPEIGFRFESWEGDLEGRENPVTVAMSSNRVIRARFQEDPEGPRLLSARRPVRVSSVEAPGLEGTNAVDGNVHTRWSSKFADPQWIEVDLGRVFRITDVKLVWERAHAKRYELQVSADGKKWRRIREVRRSRGGIERLRDLKAVGRFVRLVGRERATEWGYSLWEMEIYGYPR